MSIIIFIAALLAVCLIFWLLRRPLKFILKIVINAVIGALLLLILNHFGEGIGLFIPINWLTSLVVGVLGVPGLLILVAVALLFPAFLPGLI